MPEIPGSSLIRSPHPDQSHATGGSTKSRCEWQHFPQPLHFLTPPNAPFRLHPVLYVCSIPYPSTPSLAIYTTQDSWICAVRRCLQEISISSLALISAQSFQNTKSRCTELSAYPSRHPFFQHSEHHSEVTATIQSTPLQHHGTRYHLPPTFSRR